MVPTNSF
jgi:hypothetical protein